MNTFGRKLKITIFGESHGKGVGIVIDGIPPGIPISEKDFDKDIKRRQPNKSGTTKRKEPDKAILLSGIFNGYTTGAPLTIFFENSNIKSKDYEIFKAIPRPGHADFTAKIKYKGFNDYRGGGMFSGRMTLPLVAAGVVAKKIIQPAKVNAYISEIYGKKEYQTLLQQAQKEGDSLGGLIECKISNFPPGIGEPFFDSVESYISHLVFAIPGVKGIEFGAGFKAAKMKGSEYNDIFISTDGKTLTNNAGGINGGITNGNDIIFRVAIKPTSSIYKRQYTLNFKTGKMEYLKITGRHDIAIVLRVPVIIEAAAAIALADLKLLAET